MIGFILAAGFGTRLRPLTDHIPKALVPVCGKPLLSHNLEYLYNQGITTIGVNSHYLHEQMEAFQRASSIPFTLFHEKEKIRGTGGPLDFARDFLGIDETFCVCNVDILNTLDLRSLSEQFLKMDCSVALIAVRSQKKGTVIYNQENGEYLGVAADLVSHPDASTAEFIGMTLYKKEFLDCVNKEDFSIIPIWSRAKALGMRISVLVYDNIYWCDIGTPSALAQIHFDRIDQHIKLSVPENLQIDLEKKVCLPVNFPEKKLVGPYSWIEYPDIPEGCTISRSVVFSKATLHKVSSIVNKLVTPWGDILF